MTATVAVYAYTGTAPGSGQEVSKIRFKNADTPHTIDTTTPCLIPAVGTNRSWWVSLALYAIVAPDVAINNVNVFPAQAQFLTANRPFDVDIDSGDYYYVAGRIAGTGPYFQVYDCNNLDDISLVAQITLPHGGCDPGQYAENQAYGVNSIDSQYVLVSGTGYCYPGTAHSSIITWVIDVSDKNNPTIVNTLYNTTWGYTYRVPCIYKNPYWYYMVTKMQPFFTPISNTLYSFSVTSLPASVPITDTLTIETNGDYSKLAIMENDDYLFVTLAHTDVMAVVDVSNPASLQYVKAVSISDPDGLGIYRDAYLYVCRGSQILETYDIRTPANPVLVDTLDNASLAGIEDIEVHPSNNRALVLCDDIIELDLSDPANPSIIGAYSTSDVSYGQFRTNHGLAWNDTTIYVGNETSSTYVQATGDADNGSEMVTNHGQITAKTDFTTYTNSSKKSVSGSIGATTGRISNFVVLQLDIGPAALTGDRIDDEIMFEYDEI